MKKEIKKSGPLPLILLLILIIFAIIILAVQVNVSVKYTAMTGLSTQDAWKTLTDVDHQVFWRTNLINITHDLKAKTETWKEIFSGDRERTYQVLERVDGERLVKSFNPDQDGQEKLTIIILPARAGSKIALIDTVKIINPVQKFALKLQPSSKAERFRKFNDLLDMFTNSLLKDRSADFRPLASNGRSGTN